MNVKFQFDKKNATSKQRRPFLKGIIQTEFG